MKLIFFTSIALFCVVLVHAQTVDEILSKSFASIGGIEKWKALNSFTCTGKAFLGQDFPMVIYKMKPNKSKMTMNIQGTEIVMSAYDGTTAWQLNPLGGGKDPMKLSDEIAVELKEDEFESPYIDYKTKGHEVSLVGKEEIDGMMCYKIKIIRNKNNPKDDITEFTYFDLESFIPLIEVKYARSGAEKGTEMKTYLSDYQEVNGLMFPFSIEQKVNGKSQFKASFDKITINDIKDESVFAYPKK